MSELQQQPTTSQGSSHHPPHRKAYKEAERDKYHKKLEEELQEIQRNLANVEWPDDMCDVNLGLEIRCITCDEVKSEDQFDVYKMKNNHGAIKPICLDCRRSKKTKPHGAPKSRENYNRIACPFGCTAILKRQQLSYHKAFCHAQVGISCRRCNRPPFDCLQAALDHLENVHNIEVSAPSHLDVIAKACAGCYPRGYNKEKNTQSLKATQYCLRGTIGSLYRQAVAEHAATTGAVGENVQTFSNVSNVEPAPRRSIQETTQVSTQTSVTGDVQQCTHKQCPLQPNVPVVTTANVEKNTRQKNKRLAAEYSRAYHYRNKEQRNQASQAYRIENTRLKFQNLCIKAKERDLDVEISEEYAARLMAMPCFYCGVLPNQGSTSLLNGIDRVDSSRNYVQSNCVPSCGTCNIMKGKLTIADFLKQCHLIHEHVVLEVPTAQNDDGDHTLHDLEHVIKQNIALLRANYELIADPACVLFENAASELDDVAAHLEQWDVEDIPDEVFDRSGATNAMIILAAGHSMDELRNHFQDLKACVQDMRRARYHVKWHAQHEWQLTDEQAFALMSCGECTYCGLHGIRLGIDRVDSTKEYTVDNTVSACQRCNFMKRGFRMDVFLQRVTAISKIFPDETALSIDQRCLNFGLPQMSHALTDAPALRQQQARVHAPRARPPSRQDWLPACNHVENIVVVNYNNNGDFLTTYHSTTHTSSGEFLKQWKIVPLDILKALHPEIKSCETCVATDSCVLETFDLELFHRLRPDVGELKTRAEIEALESATKQRALAYNRAKVQKSRGGSKVQPKVLGDWCMHNLQSKKYKVHAVRHQKKSDTELYFVPMKYIMSLYDQRPLFCKKCVVQEGAPVLNPDDKPTDMVALSQEAAGLKYNANVLAQNVKDGENKRKRRLEGTTTSPKKNKKAKKSSAAQ